MPIGFKTYDRGDSQKIMAKLLWVACSSRSEYGLIRPLLKELAASQECDNNSLGATLILYSDALSTCDGDASRDLSHTSIKIVRLHGSKIRKGESINEHFGRLVHKFSRNEYYECDLLLVAGDRYELFALVQAAFYQQIPLAHLFGGDISNGGTFDDHVRHSMSHLASVHFPVNQTAYNNLISMHQDKSRIFFIGSPVVDELSSWSGLPDKVGKCDVLISFNPMTLESSNVVGHDLRLTLEALELIQSQITLRCLATFPNHEPGAQVIIDTYKDYEGREWFMAVKSLGSPKYLFAIRDAKIVLGNSSSQVLEVPLLGQRSLLIGNRQNGRHKPASVVHLPSVTDAHVMKEIILNMLKTEAPQPCNDYGAAGVSRSIIKLIRQLIALPRKELVRKNSPIALKANLI